MSERILVIEDDPQIADLLRRGLIYEGYAVETAGDGEGGLVAARDRPPDLVLLDLMLPGIDGYSLTNQIGEDPELCGIPLIIMSALTTSRSMFETMPRVAAFFSKPFSNENFIEAVKNALAKKE